MIFGHTYTERFAHPPCQAVFSHEFEVHVSNIGLIRKVANVTYIYLCLKLIIVQNIREKLTQPERSFRPSDILDGVSYRSPVDCIKNDRKNQCIWRHRADCQVHACLVIRARATSKAACSNSVGSGRVSELNTFIAVNHRPHIRAHVSRDVTTRSQAFCLGP
jgi:hypothetical protein